MPVLSMIASAAAALAALYYFVSAHQVNSLRFVLFVGSSCNYSELLHTA